MVFILKKNNLKEFVFILLVVITIFLIIYILISKATYKVDEDYEKLDLELSLYNIDYYTIYEEKDSTGQYKVYKLNLIGQKEEFKKRLEKSIYWSKNKFYEYIMMRFYEKIGNERVKLDREDLYYCKNKQVYAIFDLKNEKLYYFENNIWNNHKEYSNILGIETKKYNTREIYSVRGGPQNDGLDYYVYEFPKECGQDIIKELNSNTKWCNDRLDDKILDNFIYNKEVFEVKNGYYYYELVCRTRDENKKKNVTKENATGCEIGVFDADKNILYYYWQSI